MGNPFDSGGGNGGGIRMMPVPRTNEERRSDFATQYGNSFNNNQRFQDSLRGFYGGQPFADIANRVAQQNTFQRQVPRLRAVPKGPSNGGFADSLVGNPFVPPDIQFGMLPLTLF